MLENLSARDMFWLHPTLSLRQDTTAAQMHFILDALGHLLAQDQRVERIALQSPLYLVRDTVTDYRPDTAVPASPVPR